MFHCGAERVPFGSGDSLFGPAGVPHTFKAFSPDFRTWATFFGLKGGYRA